MRAGMAASGHFIGSFNLKRISRSASREDFMGSILRFLAVFEVTASLHDLLLALLHTPTLFLYCEFLFRTPHVILQSETVIYKLTQN